MSFASEKEYVIEDKSKHYSSILKRFFSNVKGKILEVGCGLGNFVAVNPDQIMGIDIDEDALKTCSKRGLNCKYGDISKPLEFSDDSFGGVFGFQVIEHLWEPLPFMKEVYRVLKKGGKAVFYTPDYINSHHRFFWDDYTHRRPFTKKSLYMLAYDAGFRKIETYSDFKQMTGMGFLIYKIGVNPEKIRKIHNFLKIKGNDLILVVHK